MGKRSLEKNSATRIVVVAFAIICVLMGVLCFQYYRQVQNTVKLESGEYLREISRQISTNVSKTINDNFSVLGTISTVLRTADVQTYAQLLPIVQDQRKFWNYQNIMLVDDNGTAYDVYGKTISLASDSYLIDAVLGRKKAMSPSQLIDDRESIIFALPVSGLTIGGNKISALAASYDLDTFDRIISMSAFGGKGYAHIIRKDGTVVVRSSSDSALHTGYNIFNSLSGAAMDSGDSFEKVKDDILVNRTGLIGFTVDGQREYMAYTPLDNSDWYLVSFVSASVVNEKSSLLLQLTLLLCSFITVVFALLLTFLLVSSYRHRLKLEKIAYVDPITDGNTIQRFYTVSKQLLEASDRLQYALIYTNIEKFKVFNEQFGRHACDLLLKSLHEGINADLTRRECSGRLFADNFCILIEFSDEPSVCQRFERWYENAVNLVRERKEEWLSPIIEFGVYVITDQTMPFPQMIDRAKLALRESARELRGKLRCAIYDEEVRRRLFREKKLEDMMEEALARREFLVYLQPKYLVKSETIGGAEALVRWMSARDGMIYPDEFISLFEKNGFIIRLDMWVFEEVCRVIRSWLDDGLEPVKISVNCSRMHLRIPDFLEKYRVLCEQYRVPPKYIEIELTENVVFEDVGRLSQLIDNIHNIGFGCSMDDFGSGYSSLNLIQDIPVDTIKLDKVFFRNTSKDLRRTESVVGSIVTMAHALSMITVAEGVERREQVDMLKQLGCDYIQGFFFAKPMPVPEFEQLLFGRTIDIKE